MDAAAVVVLLLAIFVLLFGGFDLHLPFVLRVHSVPRLLLIAAALIAIRHAASPTLPLHHRLLRGLRAQRANPAAGVAWQALASRVVVLIVAYFAVLTVGLDRPSVGFQLSPEPLFNLPARFDAGWYGGIALDGYSFRGAFDRQQNVAFFPAFPLLMRVAGYPIGAFAPNVVKERRMGRLLWGGVIISVMAFAWAARYLWRLARDLGLDEGQASAAAALLAAYPFSVYYSAPYTESLFLLGSVAAIYHFRRRELLAAAAWGLLVGFTRPNGCFLGVVLVVLLAQEIFKVSHLPNSRLSDSQISKFEISRSVLAASAPGIAMLLFSTYVYRLTGSFFGWARLHEAWGRSYQGLAPVTRAYGWLTDEGLLHVVEGVPYDTLNTLAVVLVLLMLWPVARRLGLAFAVFILINAVPPILAGGALSMGRLTATLFPVFLALAATLRPRAVTALVTGFAIAQGLAVILFFTWRPLF